MDYLVFVFLGISLVANATLTYLHLKRPATLTKDAKALLNEILSGGAIVKIDVLDAGALMYRSPKG